MTSRRAKANTNSAMETGAGAEGTAGLPAAASEAPARRSVQQQQQAPANNPGVAKSLTAKLAQFQKSCDLNNSLAAEINDLVRMLPA